MDSGDIHDDRLAGKQKQLQVQTAHSAEFKHLQYLKREWKHLKADSPLVWHQWF